MSPGPMHMPAPESGLTRRLAVVVLAALVLAVLLLLFMTGRVLGPTTAAGGIALTSLSVIDGPGTGAAPTFDQPLGVAIAKDGTIYVADSGNNRVCAFTRTGKFLREWGGFGMTKPLPGIADTWKPGLLNYPTGIDVGEDGLIYVADFHNDQVSVFDPKGDFVRAFPDPDAVTGRGGSGKDGRGIAVTDVSESGGYVVATDTYQVFVFTTAGTLVRQFGKPGSGLTDLDHPNGIATEGDRIYLADSNHQRLVAFDLFGSAEWAAGGAATSSDATGAAVSFGLPRGVSIRETGDVLVADPVNQSLVLLDRQGRRMGTVGTRGTAAGQFNFPTDVDTLDDLVVVADKENNRVQVMRLTGEVDRDAR